VNILRYFVVFVSPSRSSRVGSSSQATVVSFCLHYSVIQQPSCHWTTLLSVEHRNLVGQYRRFGSKFCLHLRGNRKSSAGNLQQCLLYVAKPTAGGSVTMIMVIVVMRMDVPGPYRSLYSGRGSVSHITGRPGHMTRSRNCEKRPLASSCLSVRIEQSALTGRIFMKFDIRVHFSEIWQENSSLINLLTLWRLNFFQILAHPVFKM
jgi:hypothetical protein